MRERGPLTLALRPSRIFLIALSIGFRETWSIDSGIETRILIARRAVH